MTKTDGHKKCILVISYLIADSTNKNEKKI